MLSMAKVFLPRLRGKKGRPAIAPLSLPELVRSAMEGECGKPPDKLSRL
jgi:hypothetical protein